MSNFFWFLWWLISFGIIFITLISAFLLNYVFKYKKDRVITPNKTLFIGVFLSAVTLFFPIYIAEFSIIESSVNWVHSILISIQHAFRLFALDGDYLDRILKISCYPNDRIKLLYSSLGAVLYASAPFLTFGFILSFVKNLSAHRRYLFSFWKKTHIFSELNERTLALATDILNNSTSKIISKNLIVFTDVLDKNEEENIDLIEDAKELGAVLFRKDLESVKFRFKYSLRKINFYLISEDEPEKLRHTKHIIKHYDYNNVSLRVFSQDVRCKMLLSTDCLTGVKNIDIVRIDDIQALIYHELNEHGINLFRRARCVSRDEKVISAVIVGLGKYGCEMLKALTWFCQLEGYKLKINAFDEDKHAEDKFTDMCPELMDKKFNGVNIDGEAKYEIKIHSGIDVNVPEFSKKLSEITDATYIFVCLGDDDTNLSAAVKIRSICERVEYIGDKHKPDIETVIYNSNISDQIGNNRVGITWNEVLDSESKAGAKNYRGQPYNILMIGELKSFYSWNTVINSDLQKEGKEIHMRYSRYYANIEFEKLLKDGTKKEEEREKFIKDEEKKALVSFRYEYCYHSSIAKAMHEKLRKDLKLNIPGLNKEWAERTEEEKTAIGKVEHVRWNAYMRTEGYCHNIKRNDLAKLHHNLVPITDLSDEDLGKDA